MIRPYCRDKSDGERTMCAGISEQALPDGNVTFQAARDDEIGHDALIRLCKGRGVWNPAFRYWLCAPQVAATVRAALPDAVRLGRLP